MDKNESVVSRAGKILGRLFDEHVNEQPRVTAEQAIESSQLDMAFESIALDALAPLLEASDCGHTILPPTVWARVLESVKERIAEVYFGASDRLPE